MHAANISLCRACTQMFVLDEADEMLSRGFKDQIYDIFQLLPPKIQVRQCSSEVQCCNTGMWRGSCSSSTTARSSNEASGGSYPQQKGRGSRIGSYLRWHRWHRGDVGLGPRCSSMC